MEKLKIEMLYNYIQQTRKRGKGTSITFPVNLSLTFTIQANLELENNQQIRITT